MSRFYFPALLHALAAALLLNIATARADEAQEISRMLKQGQQEKALERANNYLSANPRDAQVRFIKGLILTEQNKTAEAIKVFTGITDDYPELPEPYNNLAVLYASQGQYEKARTALEMAINTHPSYATAHENLGDIYAKMASQAYDKALQLDKGNTNAQSKLALVKDIFSRQPTRMPVKPAAAPVTGVPVPAKPAPQPAPPVPVKAVAPAQQPAAAATKPAPEPVRPAAVEKPAPDTGKPTDTSRTDESEAVLAALNAWARAWSDRNISGYLKSYATDLVLDKGETRASWEKSRKERISRPKSISVKIGSPEVKILDASHARVTFRQTYRSSGFNSETWKTMQMVKSNGKWLIHEERIGR